MLKRRHGPLDDRGGKRPKVVFAATGYDAGARANEIQVDFMNMGRDMHGNDHVVKMAVRALCYEELFNRNQALRFVNSDTWGASRVAQAYAILEGTYQSMDWEIRGCGALAGLSGAAAWYRN